jgi:large-conductance mechanosensitive channel
MGKYIFNYVKGFASKYLSNVKQISGNAVGFAMANEVSIFLNILILGLILPLLQVIFPVIRRLREKKIKISGTEIPIGEIIDAVLRFIFVTILFYFMLGMFTNSSSEVSGFSKKPRVNI